MSLIETQLRPVPLASAAIPFASSAALTQATRFSARGEIRVIGTGVMRRQIFPHALGAIEFAGEANARLNGEPNVFLQALGTIDSTASAAMRRRIKPYAAGAISFFSTANKTVTEQENSSLQLVVDIRPAAPASKYIEQKARLTVDGSPIPIKSFQYQEPRRAVGANLSVRLARLSDKNSIARNSVIKFEIGTKRAGVWQWVTKFDSGELTGKDYSIGWATNQPTDTLSIRAAGDLNKRLSRTPATDLIFYNPAKTTLSQTDFEPIYDTSGRAFSTQLAAANLSLHYLFDQIFVTRCGFDSVETNIPNYQISRADFGFGSGYLSGIAPLVGMFEPVFFVRGNVLWILDTTAILPAGFPAPRTITPTAYRGLNLSESHQKIDALLLSFSETDSAFDYFTTRLEQKTEESGTYGTLDFTRLETSRTIREYRKSSAPALVVKTDVRDETKSTYDYQLNLIGRETNQFFFDAFGRQTRVQKRIEGRVPNFALPNNPVQLLTVREETALTVYAAHPFEPRRQFQKSFIRQIRGLIAVDAENEYLDAPFKQDFTDAHRAGNLADGITTEFGPLKTVTETQKPQRDGTVKIETQTVDHVRGIVINPASETRAGDVSLNGSASKQSRVLVFAEDNAVRSTERVEPFAVGQLPLVFAAPLARRRLKKRQSKTGDVSFDLIGFDETIERGTILTAVGRSAENLGAFLIEGLTVTGDERGIISETIEGQQI